MKPALRSLASANPVTLTLAAILLVFALFALRVPILELTELRTYDLRVRARGARQPSTAVVMAVIDERSLDAEGRWPWPRSKIAALVDALSRDGARVIAFDVAFAEPAAAEDDLALANAIRRSPARVVLGYFLHWRVEDLGYRLDPGEIGRRASRVAKSRYPMIRSSEPDLRRVPFMKAYAPQPNIDVLTEAASSSGYFTFTSDEDGVLRRMPLAVQVGEEVFAPLALVSAWDYLGRPELVLRVGRHGVDGAQLGGTLIPTDESGQLLIDYLGPPRTIPGVSASDVLRGKVAPGTFADRIVLVGATAVGTHDLRSSPFSPAHAGTEINATVIDDIVTGRFLDRPEWWKVFDLLAIVLLASLVAIAVTRTHAVTGLLSAATLFAAYVFLAGWLFARHGIWLSMVYPLLALTLDYTGLTAYRYLTEERERRRMKAMFGQYVAPVVVEELIEDPGRLKLGGEEKVLTVLFSDLEGFTSQCERYTPREMVGILGDYYERMTEQVFAQGGTLKEYVGDELMAFFGAPIDQPDHAARACAAALAMREQRLALNGEWAASGRPPLRARTGINSGPMLVGNLGSSYRFAYGVLGDQVNLGSRLEGLNRVYGTDILVGESTALLVQPSYLLRELDVVRVKGKQQAVRVYELLARAGARLPPGLESAVAQYAAALEAYRQQRWDEALALFEQALAIRPDDGPSRTMAHRCRTYRRTPPAEEWDGAFEQTLGALKGTD
jgi:adenylate cyclase